nr:TlpA family protein disulfide reductase [Geodermatophilaceae bacterium]
MRCPIHGPSLVLLAGALVLSACTGSDPPAPTEAVPTVSSDLAACPAAGADATAEEALPGLVFPCLGGDVPFTLGDAPGTPTVLNLWAPWCPPCREELPLFQQLHERADGDVRVLGLVERDTAASSVAYAEQVGLGFG